MPSLTMCFLCFLGSNLHHSDSSSPFISCLQSHLWYLSAGFHVFSLICGIYQLAFMSEVSFVVFISWLSCLQSHLWYLSAGFHGIYFIPSQITWIPFFTSWTLLLSDSIRASLTCILSYYLFRVLIQLLYMYLPYVSLYFGRWLI